LIVRVEIISQEDQILIHRAILAPGEATPWHQDACRRFTVVVRGDGLTIEYRDGERAEITVHPGLADWEEPQGRLHRAVNTGQEVFEEVVTFFLEYAEQVPQPEVSLP